MNSKVTLTALAALNLTLAGCATAKAITGPDGTEHQLVRCPTIDLCYSKATEVCGGKYQIVNTSTDVSGGSDGTSSTTNLLVKCQR